MAIAVIAVKSRLPTIKEAADELDEQIVHSADTVASASEALGILSTRITVAVCVVDYACFADKENPEADKELVSALRKLRIQREQTRIIVLAPDLKPGDEVMSQIVKLGIYDIVPFTAEDDFKSVMKNALLSPATYFKGVKWDTDSEEFKAADGTVSKPEIKTVVKKEYVEVSVEVEKEIVIGSPVIAVAGLGARVGVTHTCIALAWYLKQKKFKVAIVETHGAVFSKIRRAYTDAADFGNSFELDGVRFFENSKEFNFAEIVHRYNYIIFDIGEYGAMSAKYRSEFERANVKLLLAGVKDWEIGRLEAFLTETDEARNYKYLLSFCDDRTYKAIVKRAMSFSIFQGVYNPDPFQPDAAQTVVCDRILKDILPTEKQKHAWFHFMRGLMGGLAGRIKSVKEVEVEA